MVRALALVGLCTACAGIRTAQAPRQVDLIDSLRADGFDVHDPALLSPQSANEVRMAVGFDGTLDSRLQRLTLWITDQNGLAFRYAKSGSLDAEAAYHARTGNCMTFANLFRGAARALGADTFYVQVSEMPAYFAGDSVFYYASHIAVGYRDGAQLRVVDLARVESDWRPALYRPISAEAGEALYFSNLAVELLTEGDNDHAVRLLKGLLEAQGDLPELHSNLGAALLRAGRYREASDLLAAAIDRFPAYAPLYGNAIVASRAAGLPQRADQLAQRARDVASADPYFLFGEGLELYQRGQYEAAAKMLDRASRAQPQSVEIKVWQKRAEAAASEKKVPDAEP